MEILIDVIFGWTRLTSNIHWGDGKEVLHADHQEISVQLVSYRPSELTLISRGCTGHGWKRSEQFAGSKNSPHCQGLSGSHSEGVPRAEADEAGAFCLSLAADPDL